jgi:hypothetical protein
VKNRFNSTLRRVFASQRREAKATSTGGGGGAGGGSRKRKGSAPTNAGASAMDGGSKKRARGFSTSQTTEVEAAAPAKRTLLGKPPAAGGKRGGAGARAAVEDTTGYSEDDERDEEGRDDADEEGEEDEEARYYYGSDSGDETTTLSGLEQLMQASLEVERMEQESGGDAGGAEQSEQENIQRDGDDVMMQEESSVRDGKAFVDHARLLANIQMQQHLVQLAGGAATTAPGAAPAPAAHLQRYPSFHSGATAGAAAKDAGGEDLPRSDSPTSSGGSHFAMQQAQGAGGAGAGSQMNLLVLQMLLLQQQQQQQQQQAMNPTMQRLMLEQAASLSRVNSPSPALGGAKPGAEACAGVGAGEASEGSGLSAGDSTVAGAHHFYAQMQGLFGMMMGAGGGAGPAAGGME